MKTFKALGRKFGLLALSLLVLALMLPASAARTPSEKQFSNCKPYCMPHKEI